MAWVRSDQALKSHPKTIVLKALLGIELDAIVGRIHFLWWWCLDYAIDGDLRKKDPKIIEDACQIPISKLIRAGFVDRLPYRRIHGWYEIQGNYLRARFQHQPEKWKRIKELYENEDHTTNHTTNNTSNHTTNTCGNLKDVRTYGRTNSTDVRTLKEKESASLCAPLGGAVATREKGEEPERMTPEEMKSIRIKNMGDL